MTVENYLIYGCSSSRTTPGVITIQELHAAGKTSHQTFALMKTSFAFVFRRRLDQDEYIHLSPTSSEDTFKTSSRCLGQDQHICLGNTSSRRFQDVFKTSSTRLVKTSSRLLQDIFKAFCQDIFKTSSRRLQDVLVKTNIFVLAIRLQDVSKTSCQDVLQKRLQDIFKTSSRRLQDIFKTSWKDIFKTFSRLIIKLNCSC